MRHYNLTLIILTFFISNSAFSQKTDNSSNSSYILSSLSSSFPSGSPRYTLGYLKELNTRWQIGLEFGYGTFGLLGSEMRDRRGLEDAYKLFEVRPRINYIITTKSGIKPYVSSELFYINQKDQFINDTESLRNLRYINNGFNEDNTVITYDRANFSRIKYGINFNIGCLWEIWKKFGINYNLGIGIRNRNIQYSNVTNPDTVTHPDSDSFFTPLHLLETGNHLGANFSLNFKLFYRLN